MKNLLQSVVLAEIVRVAELTPAQAMRVAGWLLDHDVRFVSHDAPVAAGMTLEFFQALRDLCLHDKRISAIKELREWAINHADSASFKQLGTLKGAKDFIDEHFPRGEHPGVT